MSAAKRAKISETDPGPGGGRRREALNATHADVLQPVYLPSILPYLDLKDGLSLRSACESLSGAVDPFQFCYIYALDVGYENMELWIEANKHNMSRHDATIISFRKFISAQYTALTGWATGSVDKLRSVLKNDSVGSWTLKAILKKLAEKEKCAALELILADERCPVEGILEFALRKGLQQSVTTLRGNGRVEASVSMCCLCKIEVGAYQCLRKEDNEDGCLRGDIPNRNGDTGPDRFCASCVRPRCCSVCERYQCSHCDNVEEFHPECDLRLYLKRCSTCHGVACRVFNSSCYSQCSICEKTECAKCMNGKKWVQCSMCSEDCCEGADVYTCGWDQNTFFCPSCAAKPCPIHGKSERDPFTLEEAAPYELSEE